MTNSREKYGPCFVHASSSGELPKWRSHVSVYAHISGEGAKNINMANTARGKACWWISRLMDTGDKNSWRDKIIWIIIVAWIAKGRWSEMGLNLAHCGPCRLNERCLLKGDDKRCWNGVVVGDTCFSDLGSLETRVSLFLFYLSLSLAVARSVLLSTPLQWGRAPGISRKRNLNW